MAGLKSINPYNQALIAEWPILSDVQAEEKLDQSFEAWQGYRERPLDDRRGALEHLAGLLRERAATLAPQLTEEMGKPLKEAKAEIEKCAWVCEFYAEQGPAWLQDEHVETKAQNSWISYEPLGPILAIMPWNFPFWQVFRFAAPSLLLGNTILLKHAPNVQGCAAEIEKLILEAGFPEKVFQNLVIEAGQTEKLIANPQLRGVTLTGSVGAGKKVAQLAGKYLKKHVLELGGSNPFIVCADADVEKSADLAVQARMMNNAQSCIAAKRFLVASELLVPFREALMERLSKLRSGDPREEITDLGPLARIDLAETLDEQVQRSLARGAELVVGGRREEAFYQPTLLDKVRPGMPAFDEELFGPVLSLSTFDSWEEAIALSNKSRYGLGVNVMTKDVQKVQRDLRKFEDAAVFVNAAVQSDPRLPFGGTKESGYGRELSRQGLHEFANIKTVFFQEEI